MTARECLCRPDKASIVGRASATRAPSPRRILTGRSFHCQPGVAVSAPLPPLSPPGGGHIWERLRVRWRQAAMWSMPHRPRGAPRPSPRHRGTTGATGRGCHRDARPVLSRGRRGPFRLRRGPGSRERLGDLRERSAPGRDGGPGARTVVTRRFLLKLRHFSAEHNRRICVRRRSPRSWHTHRTIWSVIGPGRPRASGRQEWDAHSISSDL